MCMVRYGTVLYGTNTGTVRYCTVRYGTVGYGTLTARYGTVLKTYKSWNTAKWILFRQEGTARSAAKSLKAAERRYLGTTMIGAKRRG